MQFQILRAIYFNINRDLIYLRNLERNCSKLSLEIDATTSNKIQILQMVNEENIREKERDILAVQQAGNHPKVTSTWVG